MPSLLQLSFFLTWLRASWSADTPRLRHVRKDRPVFMSGGAFMLSLMLHARLAPFLLLPLTTVSRESSLCLHSLVDLVCWDTQGIKVFLVFFQHLSASSAPEKYSRVPQPWYSVPFASLVSVGAHRQGHLLLVLLFHGF